jgi:putative transposase
LVPNTKPRKRLLGRIKRMQRRVALQKRRAKTAGQQKSSQRQYIRQLRLSRLHARVANIRRDAARKLTADLTRRFETIVIEDLNVSGLAKNHSLAGAVLDCGFYEIRRQFEYKQAIRGGRVVIANRFFSSTQTCSCCASLTGQKGREELHVERWVRCECGVEHARDGNAAAVLRKLGTAGAEVTRGDMMPLPLAAWPAASVARRQTPKEPRDERLRRQRCNQSSRPARHQKYSTQSRSEIICRRSDVRRDYISNIEMKLSTK